MAKETSSTIFKDLVNSPIGIISKFIMDRLALEIGYEPLRNFIAQIQTGKTPPMNNPEYYSSNDMEWIKPSDIGFGKYITASDWISKAAIKENKATIYKPGTVLIICIGGGIGRLGITNKVCSSNQQITGIVFNENVLAEFAYYFFLSRYEIFEANSSKSTLPIINQKGLSSLDFVCPKNNIQKEIIKYLDYCKECLNKVSHPISKQFRLEDEIFCFANKAFKAYYTQKDLFQEYKFQLTKIENLNQAILQEAVQGKLVAQNKKDEPASELLKRIKAEKAKSGKKEKLLPPIKPEEIPFEIPKSWVWCRLGEISNFIDYRGKTPNKVKTGVKLITAKNVKKGKFSTLPEEFISESDYPKHMTRGIPNYGDILFTTEAPLANACLLEYENKFALAQRIITIQPILLNNKLLLYTILSHQIQKVIIGKQSGITAKGIKSSKLILVLIPLPPLSEQKRIVAEIEKQLAKTKQLKEHIIANQQATEQLLKALLHQALEVEEMEEVLL